MRRQFQEIMGVTVCTPSYRHLEKEAVRRFKKQSGLPVHVIRRRRDSDGFQAKLELDKEAGRRAVIFFDLDWWALKPIEFPEWDGRTMMAVHDPAVFHPDSFCHKDCMEGEHRLEQMRYLNTGFMALDFRRPEMRRVFQEARAAAKAVAAGKRSRPADHTDQYYINLGALKVGVPVQQLPLAYNYYDKAAVWGFVPHRPRLVVGLHAAGVPVADKLATLRAQETIFGQAHAPVRPETLLYQHTMCHELR